MAGPNIQPPTPAGKRGATPATAAFTLLEVMVASAVLLLLSVVLLTAGNEVVKSWRRLTAEQDRFSDLLTVDRTLDSVLTNVIPFRWRDSDNEERAVFLGEPHRVRLAYRHPLNQPADGAIRFFALEAEHGELRACTWERPFVDWNKAGPAAAVTVLTTGVSGLDIRYADQPGTTTNDPLVWKDDWDPARRREPPLAIWVTVTWADGRVESWLRRTAGSGQFERFHDWRPDATP
ncbi:MAG: hypothetical protein WC708_08485 [Lentisphaeria bacterium]